MTIGLFVVLVLITGALWMFLGVFRGNCIENVQKESAFHIREISGQIIGYIEEEVNSGWISVATVS